MYDVSNSVLPEILEDTIDFTNEYNNIEANEQSVFENTTFLLTNHLDINSTFELVTSDNINLIDESLNLNGLFSNTYLGDISEFDYYTFDSDFINQYQILINTKISNLTTEYLTPIDFSALDLKTFLDFSMIDNSPFESNSITNQVSNISSNMSLIPEKIISVVDLYYDYSMSYLNLLESNSITLVSETENYSMIFQNIYESNTLDLQDYMVYSMSFLNLIESNRLDYARDMINLSMLYQNIYESNTLDLQEWIKYSMNNLFHLHHKYLFHLK